MHVLEAQQFDRPWLERTLFPLADRMAGLAEFGAHRLLEGRRLFWLFFEPSTRTRVSFESAIALLGGTATGIQVDPRSELVPERLEDRVRVINGYGYDFLLIRYHEEGGAARAAAVSRAAVINAGDGPGEHPTQALLDAYTIWKELGRLEGLRVALVGDLTYERSTTSLARLLARCGVARLDFVSPEMLPVRPEIKDELRAAGVEYRESRDVRQVAPDVDVLYLTRAHTERFQYAQRTERGTGFYAVDDRVMTLLSPGAIVMHPLPRGPELPAEMDADPRIACFRQARNGLHVRMALLLLLARAPVPEAPAP
jgi:aspartate carbamoyltransferase catalytic subunit